MGPEEHPTWKLLAISEVLVSYVIGNAFTITNHNLIRKIGVKHLKYTNYHEIFPLSIYTVPLDVV